MPRLEEIISGIEEKIQEIDKAREVIFPLLRKGVKASGKAVEALHNKNENVVSKQLEIAGEALSQVKNELMPFPKLYYSNLTLMLEQEYTEARLLQAILNKQDWPEPADLKVNVIAYLLGTADVIGELRRSCLVSLLGGEEEHAYDFLKQMEQLYSLLFNSMFPKNLVKGLRHKL